MSKTAYEIVKANRFTFHNDYPLEVNVDGCVKKIVPFNGSYANGAYFE